MHIRLAHLMSFVIGAAGCASAGAQATAAWIPLEMDTGVVARAKAVIREVTDDGDPFYNGPLFHTTLVWTYYEGDSMRVVPAESAERPRPVRASHWWHGDTLWIRGAMGLIGHTGFQIQSHNGQVRVSNLVAGDDEAIFSYTPTDSLRHWLKLPCTETYVVLDHIPPPASTTVLYGEVAFKGTTFYFLEEGVRKAGRMDMRLYFRSVPW